MFESAGVARVQLNEIVAFTPIATTLKAVEAALESSEDTSWARLSISDRLYFSDEGRWETKAGLPSRTRAAHSQVLSRSRDNLMLRLLKDGTSTLMRTRSVGPDELIANVNEAIVGASEFVKSSLCELLPPKDVDKTQINNLIMDEMPGIGLLVDGQPPYPVSEIELTNEDRLKCLVRGQIDDVQRTLRKLLLYVVARNYHLPNTGAVTLEDMCDEVLPDVLDDGLLLRDSDEGKCLRNLSQGSRVFIAFGRRGTVVVYTKAVESLAIRCSVLSMVETLRSRFQNLFIASSLMDKQLLRLAQLSEMGQHQVVSPAETKMAKGALKDAATATYIYGLAVTDPGAQLLDGSIISIMADRAEAYFEMQSLRHACQRKMEAIRTIWASYQDRRRQTLLRALRVMPAEERRA